ncbi:Spermine oxidase like protein [Argiope bruennichi]|uniref:Spermine oxidase like protein n=2 Tax=Argiope bruennichi TaxID=94029 RepID=A0A8T0F430_ARGBR|nr:Spermine oxidase like protein [Argiope bruennichi]
MSLNKGNLHIVIVGAGLAGLACALELSKNNFSKVTILEAQDRIGGRLYSTNFGDSFLELGAQWIHGSDNALFEFLKSHELLPEELEETSFEGEGKFCTSNGKIIPIYIVEEVKKIINNAKTELEKGCYDKKSTESVFSFFSRAFKSHVMKCNNDPDIALKKALFNWCVKFESIDNACDYLNDIAVQSFTEWDECPEELYHIEFSKGSRSLLDTLASLLPRDILHLKKPVKTINWCKNLNADFSSQLFSENRSEGTFPVVLECENGEKFYADSVIVTASVGFLKENMDTFFSPSLPKNKREALQHVAFGTVNKIFLIYDEPFWHADDLGFQLVWESEVTGKCEALSLENPWIYDITGFDVLPKSSNILLGWIGGEGARLMETVDEETVGKVCSDLLRIFLKRPDIPNPSRTIRSCWHSNPYIRGSYSSRTLKYYQKDSSLHDLQHSLYSNCSSKDQWPVVLFAGEALDETSFSSAHGAFRSGLKVAEQLIKLSSEIKVNKENPYSENYVHT